MEDKLKFYLSLLLDTAGFTASILLFLSFHPVFGMPAALYFLALYFWIYGPEKFSPGVSRAAVLSFTTLLAACSLGFC